MHCVCRGFYLHHNTEFAISVKFSFFPFMRQCSVAKMTIKQKADLPLQAGLWDL